jgi:hypothetical protein
MVFGTGGGEFDFVIKTYSTKELISDKNEKPNYLYLEGKKEYGSSVVRYNMQMKKISAVYKDRLLVDYEPERVVGFSPRQDYTVNGCDIPTASIIDISS